MVKGEVDGLIQGDRMGMKIMEPMGKNREQVKSAELGDQLAAVD